MPIIQEQPVIVEPVIQKEIVPRVHVVPDPDDSVPVRISEIKLQTAETTEFPIDLPQVRFVTIEQIIPTDENPIDIPQVQFVAISQNVPTKEHPIQIPQLQFIHIKQNIPTNEHPISLPTVTYVELDQVDI